jgi:hypothetical protein
MQEHMHAFLIVGSTTDKRQDEIQQRLSTWQIAPADVVNLVPEEEHITIALVREFQKRLLLAPMQSPHTAGVISNAHLLTTDAQQALLKLLEEPPPHAYIICETETPDQLLPTIVSRCQVVRILDQEDAHDLTAAKKLIISLLKSKPGEVLAEVDTHTTDRDEAKQWIRLLLGAARELLISAHLPQSPINSERITALIRKLQLAQGQLSVNCNPKLVVDRVFLST